MREIDIYESDDKLPVDTFLTFGRTGSGKTTASAGWPRPLFLVDESEGGYKSLRGLTDEQLFEPEIGPMVWGIRDIADMAAALQKVQPYIASGRVMTIVISSITFYADTYLAHLNAQRPGADSRQIYGELSVHLRWLRTSFHNLGVNIVWEALESSPEDPVVDAKTKAVIKAAQPGRPLIAGQQAEKFAAGVTYLWRTTLDVVQKDGKPFDHIIKFHTRAAGGYVSRSRIGAGLPQLPHPLLGGYKGFLTALGYDVELLRKGLPPLKTAVPVSAPKAASPSSGARSTTTTTTNKK